jgi:hypothetical protein
MKEDLIDNLIVENERLRMEFIIFKCNVAVILIGMIVLLCLIEKGAL